MIQTITMWVSVLLGTVAAIQITLKIPVVWLPTYKLVQDYMENPTELQLIGNGQISCRDISSQPSQQPRVTTVLHQTIFSAIATQLQLIQAPAM